MFDHRCLVSPVQVSAEFFAPAVTCFGLPQVSAFLFGTVQDEDGSAWTYARDLPKHGGNGALLMGNADAPAIHIRPEAASLWKGAAVFAGEAAQGEWVSGDGARGAPSFRMTHRIDVIGVREQGVIDFAGARKGPGLPVGRSHRRHGCGVPHAFRHRDCAQPPGWLGLNFHYQKPRLNHFLSRLVVGGISLAWMTFGLRLIVQSP
jgi:hypothetical protein